MNVNTQRYRRTVNALFDNREHALKAVEELVRIGIPRNAIRVSPEQEVALSSTTGAYDTTKDEKGFWASLADFFMPDEDRYTYAEAMNRGSILVTASVDDALAEKAEDVLEEYGTVNVAEREASWRKSGWTGYPATSTVGAASASATSAGTTGSSSTMSARRPGEQSIPEVEERLRVGKRQVAAGRVKVRSYIVEKPVTEQINLHSETVHVERRGVDRPVAAGEAAFRERTVEAVATSEEPVISKEARVTGEVVVKKDAKDRTQTVSDKVRSTKVEVEDSRPSAKPAAARR